MLSNRLFVFLSALLSLTIAFVIAAGRLDRSIMEMLYFRPPALLNVMKVITYCGSWWVLAPVALVGIALAYRHMRGDLAVRLALATACTAVFVELLKYVVGRTRPDVLELAAVSG